MPAVMPKKDIECKAELAYRSFSLVTNKKSLTILMPGVNGIMNFVFVIDAMINLFGRKAITYCCALLAIAD